MKRRSILEGVGKLSLVAAFPAGTVSARKATEPDSGGVGSKGHLGDGDCDNRLPPEHCRFNDYCHNITCPDDCCDCTCFH